MKKLLALTIVVAAVFCACNGGGGSGDSLNKGQFIDSAVEGLSYQTETQEGTTNKDGRFYFKDNETVLFYLGDIYLGSSPGKDIVTPIDLIQEAYNAYHPDVVKTCRMLLSLDEDGNPDNGITLTSQIINEIVGRNIDLSSNIDYDPIIADIFSTLNALNAFSNGDHFLVSSTFAQNHFTTTLAAINDGNGDNNENDDTNDNQNDSEDDETSDGDQLSLAYWPISKGNFWEYDAGQNDVEQVITSVSGDTFIIESGGVEFTYEIGKDYIGLKKIQNFSPYRSSTTYSPPQPVLPLSTDIGSSFYKRYTVTTSTPGNPSYSLSGKTTIKVYGQDTIHVPAGYFDAIRIKVTEELSGNRWSYTKYYAKGIGLVKQDETELKDYQIK